MLTQIDRFPFVSVIFPIRNEAVFLVRSLGAVLAQDYTAHGMEIILLDGLSTDNSQEIASALAASYPQVSLRLLDNPGKIVPTGINIALRQAKGEIIIRVDGHCIPAPDYVSKCVQHIQRDGVDGVGGSIDTIGSTHLANAIAIGMSSPFGVGNSAFRTLSDKSMLVDTVPFPAFTREIIDRAGLYDEEMARNEDDEYSYRIRELGGKILLADDVHSVYFSQGTRKGLGKQYYQYGLWKVRVLQKHPRQMSLRQFVPPALVLGLIVSGLLALFTLAHPSYILFFLSSFVPLLYLFANLLASCYTAFKRGWGYFPRLPVIFAILHLSYGLGFLVGFVKFWNRWGDKTGRVPVWPNASGG